MRSRTGGVVEFALAVLFLGFVVQLVVGWLWPLVLPLAVLVMIGVAVRWWWQRRAGDSRRFFDRL